MTRRQKAIAFFVALCVLLVIAALLLNVSWIITNAGRITPIIFGVVLFGLIIAGLIVGPHVPIPIVADPATVQTLSELGVILLMFSLGLEFHLAKLVRVGPTAGFTALVQSSLAAWLGFLAGQLFGWTILESVFAGAVVAMSSTTIIAKVFDEQRVGGRLRELVVGVLLVEDLMAVVDEALERFDFCDPDRLGVLGGSYGGFMTSWIVSHTAA